MDFFDSLVSQNIMTSLSQKHIIASEQEISGYHRKLAWLALHSRDLYFEMAGVLDGSHSSYHKDGTMWRTSPATNKRAEFQKCHFPLNQFQGWFNLGLGMLLKSSLENNPKLKKKDKKYHIHFVNIDMFPSKALNIVVDLLEPNRLDLFLPRDMQPPTDAHIIEITSSNPWIFVTILGHDHNLLISPYNGDFKGVTCRHFNKRYSASLPGSRYAFEAYDLD